MNELFTIACKSAGVTAVVLLLCTAPAQAEAQSACDKGSWILDGASAAPGAGSEAAFSPAWAPTIEEIAACARNAPDACIEVQGAYDSVPFSAEIERAFGGPKAAQTARARGRSGMVLDALADAGVPAAQLREIAPGSEPTRRGAVVKLQHGCLPKPEMQPAELSDADKQAIAEAKRILAERDAAASAAPAAEAESTASAPLANRQALEAEGNGPTHGSGPFFLEAGALVGYGKGDDRSAVLPGLRFALGAHSSLFYGRLGLGTTISDRADEQTGWELVADLGLRPWSWLELGPAAGVRLGGPKASDPWLQRSWFAGLAASECVLGLGASTQLCLQQGIYPFGEETSWAHLQGDQLEREPLRTGDYLRVDFGAALRFGI